MSFELFFSLRYLKAKRRQGFISIITGISILGIMIGATAVEGVISATPFIYSQVMVKKDENISGAILRGVDPDTGGKVINIDSMIRGGSLSVLDKYENGLKGVIIGVELSKQIGALPGDAVTLVSPVGKLTPLGRVANEDQFIVKGLFESGMYEYDNSLLYISLNDAKDFLSLGDDVTGIELRIKDIQKSDEVSRAVQDKLGYPYWTKDWKMMNRSLFSAIKLEKVTMFIILTMIILVGALNIISSLVMLVMEKHRDISILRTMGASSKSIMYIFLFQGLFVGLAGTFLGLISGTFLCQILEKYKFIKLPPDVYYITTLPVKMEWMDTFLISLAAILISFVATIFPSRQAATVNPVESLRYE